MIHGQFSMTHWRLTFQATFPCSLKGKNINRQLIKSYQILLNETRNLQVKKYCSFVINNSIVSFKVSISDMIFLFLYTDFTNIYNLHFFKLHQIPYQELCKDTFKKGITIHMVSNDEKQYIIFLHQDVIRFKYVCTRMHDYIFNVFIFFIY